MKSGRAGYAAGRSALSVGAAAGAAVAVQEAGLQATQELRTGGETAVNIGGSVLLGGLLGAGASRLMNTAEARTAAKLLKEAERPDFDAATDALHREVQGIAAGLRGGVGADTAAGDTLEDLAVAGKVASKVASATARLNPLLRTLGSPSTAVRDIASRLMETLVYLRKNLKGAGDTAAETAMHEWTRGAVVQALEAQERAYRSARKAGHVITKAEFREAVGRAMRRGDSSDIPGVTEAARAWRPHVIEPLKDRAVRVRLLPADVSVSTADSYFSRIWNRKKIEANEADFRKVVRGHFVGLVDEAAEAEAQRLSRTVAKLKRQKQEIEGAAAGRALGKRELRQVAEIDAQMIQTRQAARFDFVNDAERDAYLDEITEAIYRKVTGREHEGEALRGIVITKRGPLAERTFHIPDELVERFLDHDAEFVGRRYARMMSSDIELAERFGSPDMKDAIEAIRAEYATLKMAAEARADLSPEARVKELAKLNSRERADVRDITAVRDMLRGVYRPEIQHTGWARILSAAGIFNYLRTMGGVVISSLTDAVRPAMVHGLGAYMRDGLGPLIRNMRAVKMSRQEAKLAGAISERILASRLATMAEITDPYAMSAPFERFLQNMATGFTRMSGLLWWNDFQKGLVAVMVQNRVLRNAEIAAEKGFDALPAGERAYLGFLGLGQGRAEVLGTLFRAHGETLDGVRVANSEAWPDELEWLRSAWRDAINKDVDSTIVTKGAGDVPLFMNTPTGRALLQFRSFALASNQRVLIRGLQEDTTRFVSGVVGMASIGAFIYALKQLESGREVSDNPGTWIAEGLDRSGIFSVALEVNNALEKIGAPGLYAGAAAMFPDASQAQPASRYAVRSRVGSFLGPSFGAATDSLGLLALGFENLRRIGAGEDAVIGEGDIRAVRRLTPYASLPYWRWLIDGMIVPEIKEAVQ